MADRSRFAAGRSRFVAGWKKNKSGAKQSAGADSRLGPQTKVNAMLDTLKFDLQKNLMLFFILLNRIGRKVPMLPVKSSVYDLC